MDPILSPVQLFRLGLEARYKSTAERPSSPRLGYPVFLRSLQNGIVAMGVIDTFVYAHNHHRRNVDNPEILDIV